MRAAAVDPRHSAEHSSRAFVVRDGIAEGLGAAPSFLFPPDDPLAAGRRYHVSDATLRYGAGIAENGACKIAIEAMPHSEFVAVWSGEITLESADGQAVRLARGDCAVVPAGARLTWTQTGRVVRSFVVFADGADDGSTGIVRIDPDGPLSRMTNPPSPALLTSPPPINENRCDFRGRANKIRIGIWQGTPYARRQVTPAHAELMLLLTGEVDIAEASGAEWTVRTGQSIFVPAGATNAWTSAQTVRKVFCLIS